MFPKTLALVVLAALVVPAVGQEPAPLVRQLRESTTTEGFDALPIRFNECAQLTYKTARDVRARVDLVLAPIPHWRNKPPMADVIAEDLDAILPRDREAVLSEADRRRVEKFFHDLGRACKREAERKPKAGIAENR